jgi:hypothetical protein
LLVSMSQPVKPRFVQSTRSTRPASQKLRASPWRRLVKLGGAA